MTELKCPPECRVELNHLQTSIDKIETKMGKFNEALGTFLPTKTFQWIFGIMVVILITLFGAILSQTTSTHRRITMQSHDMVRVQEQLQSHMRENEQFRKEIKRIVKKQINDEGAL